jgi:hypothetical protein
MQGLEKRVEQMMLSSNEDKGKRACGQWLALPALLLILLPCVGVASRWQQKQLPLPKADTTDHIKLVLGTSKRRYHRGEPITLVAYLENTSREQAYYVGKDLGGFFSIMPYHQIELVSEDARGREAPIGRMALAPASSKETVSKKLADSYVLLAPGRIYGQSRTDVYLPSGRWNLTATYREFEARRWSPAELKLISSPVWVKPIKSNTLTITVAR